MSTGASGSGELKQEVQEDLYHSTGMYKCNL